MDNDTVDALDAEQQVLRALVEPLGPSALDRPSRCEGWSIADVLLHLAQTNELAAASARGRLAEASASWPEPDPTEDVDAWAARAVESARPTDPVVCSERWWASALDQVSAFRKVDASARVRWVSGELAARSLVSTRLAETWIHANDVATALGERLEPTERLWHIARLAHRTLPHAFARVGEAPGGEVAFELEAPDATLWTFGDTGAATVIRGPAEELCEVAGQRTSAARTSLRGTGPDADRVLALVRTFA